MARTFAATPRTNQKTSSVGARSAPILVGLGRLERPTSPLSGVRSNHLSYRPDAGIVRAMPSSKRHRSILYPEKKEKRRRPFRPAIRSSPPRRCAADIPSRGPGPNLPEGKKDQMDVVLRKEVIQPQVPLRLPCYDFTPVADPTVVACPLAVGAAPSGRTNSHGVTGGVYKARERIHRGMLIHDY